jgi:hypothetical protein
MEGRVLSGTGPGAFFFLLWLVWIVIGVVSFVVFYRGMIALAKIPDRLERIEQALAGRRSALDDPSRRDDV